MDQTVPFIGYIFSFAIFDLNSYIKGFNRLLVLVVNVDIHEMRIGRMFRFRQSHGCFDAIFAESAFALRRANLPEITVVHGDGSGP